MFKLSDFFHLSQVETYLQQLVAVQPGLLLVAGLDPRPGAGDGTGGFLPSGRSAIFRVLFDEIMTTHPALNAILIGVEKMTVPRRFVKRVDQWKLTANDDYAGLARAAVYRRPGLLVIDRLDRENVQAALDAARRGLLVLSQIDTVFHGAGVARHLADLGADHKVLEGLSWVLTVRRMATLCQNCRVPGRPDPSEAAYLAYRFQCLRDLDLAQAGLYQAGSCETCHRTGRSGDVAVFDILHYERQAGDPFHTPSQMPMEEYAAYLALEGQVAIQDLLDLEREEMRRTFHLFASSERALMEANAANERRLVQLEAANRVLRQRTEALISLESIGQALTTSTSLDDLAAKICRSARDLCGAERGILYYQHRPDQIEVLAVTGWDAVLLHQTVDPQVVYPHDLGVEPVQFNHLPPGIPTRFIDSNPPRTGLAIPLTAQDDRVGLMIIHTGTKQRFTPGEVALLKTFANQAALALQRSGLIEQLRTKIAQLEAAQVGLAQKERLEQEMALARQVQQSVLPRTFPTVAGFQFAALNEPARQVGGDFYDVIDLEDGLFGIAIGDVSDKGMPAALYMALTRSLLRAEARRDNSPTAVITSVNHLLQELGEPDMFVTVFYAVVNASTRRMTFARAGHDRPFLLRAGSAVDLPGRGPALGLLEGDEFVLSEEEMELLPGDRLVLYTDGLVDVLTSAGASYDRDQLKALLQAHAGLEPGVFCQTIFERLEAYSAGASQYDDMTMLVVHVEQPGNRS